MVEIVPISIIIYINYIGTVSIISSDPPCKDGSAIFTTVPFKSLSDQSCEKYCRFSKLKSV